jgi:hypothetical protein
MQRQNAPKQSSQRIVIISTFFLLLSIPLVVLGLSQENFDIRNRAYEEIEVSEENPCVISFPYVNPYTLEAGKTFTVQVEAETPNSTISSLQITDSSGNSIYTESFDTTEPRIYTNFKYTPETSGQVDLLGLVETKLGESYACQISSPYDVLGLRVVSNNSTPTFTTTPSESKPSQAIETNTTYEYTLTATDADDDNINYSYTFTPRADWLKPVVIDDGSNGELTIKFSGSTDKAASYLANVIIHDGYSKHISTQSWVISVSPEENDIPQINILLPLESLRLDKGDTFKAKWDATDLNQITKYQLYMASNPTDEDSWEEVNDNISYKTTEYTVGTSELTPGTYKLIARAIDNQEPSGIGMDISDEIVISGTTTDQDDSDDQAVLDEPQVTNMSPSGSEEVTNPRATIKATILAGEEATLSDSRESLSFKVDDIEKFTELKINKLSDSAYTLIYQPQEDLTAGLHKVEISLKDSEGGEVTKSWTFTTSLEEDSDTGLVTIFGYDLSQRTVIIIAGGILLIVLAIVAPIIIIKVWKDDDKPKENTKIPPTTPEDQTQYQALLSETDLKEKVDMKPVIEEEKEDVWDKYSTLPKPVEEEKQEPVSSDTTPEPLPDQGKQSTDLALLEEKQSEEITSSLPEPQPTTPEPVVAKPEISTPNEIPTTQIQENTQQAVENINKELTKPEDLVQPSIPEPDIPSFDNIAEEATSEEEILKQLSSQIKQIQQEDNQKTVPNS